MSLLSNKVFLNNQLLSLGMLPDETYLIDLLGTVRANPK